MQDIGVSMSSRPSMGTMIKLASQAKFREAAQNVMLELKNAGVDLTSRVCTGRLAQKETMSDFK